MDAYVQWVTANPLFSAAIQFAILGTLGEVISFTIQNRRLTLPCAWWQLFAKMLAWALLGLLIKYGFTGMKGFTRALLDHQMLPVFFSGGFGWALAVSVFTNTFFGPLMMAFHRLEDNLILNQNPGVVLDPRAYHHLYPPHRLPDRPGGVMVSGAGNHHGLQQEKAGPAKDLKSWGVTPYYYLCGLYFH
jgi:hypothetical protein